MAFRELRIISTVGREVRRQLYNFGEYNPDIPEEGLSQLGTEVYSRLTIPGGQYKTLKGELIEFQGVQMDAVIISVTQQKNIVKTSIQGRDGTEKEYVSSGDYNITIEGIISSGQNNVYPFDDVQALKEICKVPEPIPMVNEFLNLFEIDVVLIEDFVFPQKAGFRDNQAFKISAISDKPIEIDDDSEVIQ